MNNNNNDKYLYSAFLVYYNCLICTWLIPIQLLNKIIVFFLNLCVTHSIGYPFMNLSCPQCHQDYLVILKRTLQNYKIILMTFILIHIYTMSLTCFNMNFLFHFFQHSWYDIKLCFNLWTFLISVFSTSEKKPTKYNDSYISPVALFSLEYKKVS